MFPAWCNFVLQGIIAFFIHRVACEAWDIGRWTSSVTFDFLKVACHWYLNDFMFYMSMRTGPTRGISQSILSLPIEHHFAVTSHRKSPQHHLFSAPFKSRKVRINNLYMDSLAKSTFWWLTTTHQNWTWFMFKSYYNSIWNANINTYACAANWSNRATHISID
jgi:hypothetical protein